MLTIKERSLIFMGDFFLLFIIFIVESYAYGLNWIVLIIIAVPLIGISMSGLLYLRSLLRNSQKFGIEKREIKSIDDRTNLYVIYMMTFISLLPLFLGRNWLIQSIAFFIIMLIIYSIYINSDLLFYNPILGLFGYKYYKVTTPDENEIFIITSRGKKVKIKEMVTLYIVTDYLFLYL